MVTGRRKASRTKKEETTWQERVIQIRRVSKVVKGGKKTQLPCHCRRR